LILLSVRENNSDMPEKLKYCVYVLFSHADEKLYIGYTENLQQRLTAHFHGQSPATAPRRPFTLLYCEYHLAKRDAMRRETYFKSSSGKRTLKLMCKDSLEELRPE
jgi:putative endonuclease